MHEVQPLVKYLLSIGGKQATEETWYELAVKFDIGRENEGKENEKVLRGRAAKTRWKAFLGTSRGLELKTATLDKEGEVIGFKMGRAMEPKEIPSTEGMSPKFITVTPNGGAFVRYENDKEELTKDGLKQIISEVAASKIKKVSNWKPADNRTGHVQIAALGDCHIGMSNKENALFPDLAWTPEELENRTNILLSNIDEKASKIYLVFGGDITDGANGTTARGGHRLPQNLNNKEQLRRALDWSLSIIDGAVQITQAQIEVIWLCESNHSPLIDHAVGVTLETVANLRWNNQVVVTLQEAFVAAYNIAGRSFLLTHGYDSTHMKNGWPRHLQPQHQQFVERIIRHNYCTDPVLVRFDRHQYHDVGHDEFRDILCPAFSMPSAWLQINFAANSRGGFLKIRIEPDGRISPVLVEF